MCSYIFYIQFLGNKKVNAFLKFIYFISKFMSSGSRKVVKRLDNGKEMSLCAFFTNVLGNSSCGFVSECFIKIIEKKNLFMKTIAI